MAEHTCRYCGETLTSRWKLERHEDDSHWDEVEDLESTENLFEHNEPDFEDIVEKGTDKDDW